MFFQQDDPNRVMRGLTFLLLGLVAFGEAAAEDLMPRVEDHTSMWWLDGFPGSVDGAPWLRGIKTGRYAMVLDTASLKIPHFGPIQGDDDEVALRRLPAADLELRIAIDGKSYRCSAGGEWSRFTGPRLVESGRFFQRADVTDLVFKAEDGASLNVEARFETAAWPDRLGLILAARPGRQPIRAGEVCFGRVGGGFGLDGTNHFEVPRNAVLDAEQFTLEFWAFVPEDYQAGQTAPWLVCKNHHEQADGNFGIMIRGDREPQGRMNIGGGRDNTFVTEAASNPSLKMEAWNHLALSYDSDTMRLYANARLVGEKMIGRKRAPVPGAIAFGRRQDNSGDGYRFRGVIDEIRLYDRALTLDELRLHYVKPELDRPALKPVSQWTFREDGPVSMTKLSEQWRNAEMEIKLSTETGELQSRWELPNNETWTASDWHDVALAFDPVTLKTSSPNSAIAIKASVLASGEARPVDYDSKLGWHRVNLDGVEPIVPPGVDKPSNDVIERIKLILSNPSDREQIARLMFEKTARGFRQRIGTPITGVSAVLRDAEGNPTGIPVQLSKNWHNDPKGGVYSGQWFHGISQVRLPAAASVELELTLAYGHWGGVPAASHAQLSLIGWGGNQLWDQSALGSWGESICYDPDQAQASSTITDVRPLMVRSMGKGDPWGWTSNVGGGDFFRFFDPSGERVPHSAMRTTYQSQGPCFTEVTYAGRVGDSITHATTVSLSRSNDVVRATYRIRMDANEAADFSRFVVFQIGADTYSATGERKMAVGDESGLLREWETQWGGDAYRTERIECAGRNPWVSLHSAVKRENEKPGATANRGIVIRSWKARIGGKDASPWIAERGLDMRSATSSTLDILPPPGVTRLEPGDYVEATIEHIVMPQFAEDYYGPNEALKAALAEDENTWRMIHREAVGNAREVEMEVGSLNRLYPDVRIHTQEVKAKLRLTGGLGYVPITFTGLSSNRGHRLLIDGRPLDQSMHGADFWQTDYDASSQSWSRTYNIDTANEQAREIHFLRDSP